MAFKPDRLRQVQSHAWTFEAPLAKAKEDDDTAVAHYTYWDELYFGRGQNVATGSPVRSLGRKFTISSLMTWIFFR